MARREPAGLDAAYRRYSPQLFAYCLGLLRDSDAAADAVHDTFVLASNRVGQLRDPGRLRPWLYAIARHECLRIARTRGRSVALDLAGDPVADVADPTVALHALQLRDLVHTAAASLGDGDRDVIMLALRHHLSATDIGAALGLPANHAHARLSRARGQLERAIGALLVARDGAAGCADLAGLLAGWDGRLTPLLRKRLVRHLDTCVPCGGRRARLLSPSALLAGYAALPLLAIVPGAQVWRRVCESTAAPGAPDGTGVRLDPDTGFPRPSPAKGRAPIRRGLTAAAVLLLLLLLTATAVLVVRRPGATARDASSATSVDSGAGSPASPAATGKPSAEPPAGQPPSDQPRSEQPPSERPPSEQPPSEQPPSEQPPSHSTAPQLVAAFTVSASGDVTCTSGGFTVAVTVTGHAGTLRHVWVHWRLPNGTENSRQLSNPSSGSVGPFTVHRVRWWVTADATDGSTAHTAEKAAADPCPQPAG